MRVFNIIGISTAPEGPCRPVYPGVRIHLAPLFVADRAPERLYAVIPVSSAAEDDQGVLFRAFTELGVLTILDDSFDPSTHAAVAFVVFVVPSRNSRLSKALIAMSVECSNESARCDDGDFFIPFARAIALQSRTVAVRLTERGFIF